jgi:hypothetical protein
MGQLNAAHFVDLGRASSGAMVCATCSVRGFGWDGRNFCRQAAFLVVASWVFAPVFRATAVSFGIIMCWIKWKFLQFCAQVD